MGKASSNKKVARAASTGGGRTAGVRRPYGWYSVLAGVVFLGTSGVAFSVKDQRAAAAVHPRGQDHWHAVYSIGICGVIQPNLPQNSNLVSGGATPAPGLHTHGDGLIHVEPFVSGASLDAGNNATLGRFAQTYPGLKLTSKLIQYPGQPPHKNGDKCPTKPGEQSGKPGEVRFRVWRKAKDSTYLSYTNPNDIHLKDGQAVAVAFGPNDADIPKPPKATIDKLKNPGAAEPGQSPAPTPPASTPLVPGTTPATTPPATTPPATATKPPTSGGAPSTPHP